MKDFQGGSRKPGGFGGRDNFRSGGSSRGGFGKPRQGGFGGGRDSERPTMHHAICSDCGNDCEVPFRPSGTKPVLCSNCFAIQRGEEPRSFSGRDREFSAPTNNRERDFSAPKAMFKAVCQECHNECEVPFRPTAGKPIFCSDCFHGSESNTKRPAKAEAMSNDQLNSLNAKLDKIIALLDSKNRAPKTEKIEDVVKEAAKKEVAVKTGEKVAVKKLVAKPKAATLKSDKKTEKVIKVKTVKAKAPKVTKAKKKA
ncbi:MAG: hypothetical protein PHE20_02605 [Patescibacteria group bacterium]|nr:hypothetical protein [Patescibacteria group bacterium]